MKSSSFFPQDTRTSEFISAISLIIFSICCINRSHVNIDIIPLLKFHVVQFWVVITAVLGFIQLISVGLYPRTEILRIISSWVAGSFWVWISLTSYKVDPSDIGVFVLGMANLYAFSVNSLLLRKTWEN